MVADVEEDFEGQKRKRGHVSESDGVEAIKSMVWIMKLGFCEVEDECECDGGSCPRNV